MRVSWPTAVALALAFALGTAGAAVAGQAPSPAERIQVLVELTDTPSLRVYEATLAGSTPTAARAAERAQDQKIKEAQASLGHALAGLGAKELYRVRRSFNGIAVLLGSEKLAALRALPGVKAVYPRQPPPQAGESPVPAARSAEKPSDPGPASAAGLRAYRDPKTGLLTDSPTDAQVRELNRLLGETVNDSSEGLEVEVGPDGSKYVDLKGRFQSVSLATRAPDGGPRLHCTDRPEAARRLLSEPPASGGEKE